MEYKIAVIGKMRSGKDSFSKEFIDVGFKEFKFGTGIAEIIQKYFPEEWAKGKPRHLYQAVGQGLRQIDPYIWIDYCLRQIEASGAGNIIITDVRQENEIRVLKKLGYIIFKVEADEEIRIQRMLAAGDNIPDDEFALYDMLNHETEIFTDKVSADMVITNHGDLESLQKSAKYCMSMLGYLKYLKEEGK